MVYLCICQAVTVSEVKRLAEAGAVGFDELVARFSLGEPDSCGACLDVLRELLLEIAPSGAAAGCHRASEGVAFKGAPAHRGSE